MKDIACLLNALPSRWRAAAGWLELARAVRATAPEKIFRGKTRRCARGVDNRRNGVNAKREGSRKPSCGTYMKTSGDSCR